MSEEIDEIWQLYADDGGQSLDTVEENLLFVRENPTDQADIAALFRAMHTFKGNCRVLGLGVIESRAHLAEDLIGLVRDDGVPLDPQMLSLLLETVDALRGMMEGALASRRDSDEEPTSDLADRMRAKFNRCKAEQAAALCASKKLEGTDAVAPSAPEAIIFEPVSKSALSEDPMYRDMFSAMANKVVREMRLAMEEFALNRVPAEGALAKEVEQLHFAADQIGMREWRDVLAAFLALNAPSVEQVQTTIERLTLMLQRDFGPQETGMKGGISAEAPVSRAAVDSVPSVLDEIEPALAATLGADERLARDDAVDAAESGADRKCLNFEMAVTDQNAKGRSGTIVSAAESKEAESVETSDPLERETMSTTMLESIGAIVTGQAVVRHTLAELAEDDLVSSVEREVRNARGDWNFAREPVYQYLAGLQEKVERLVEVESQVNSLLNRLQEEAVVARNRSATLLLRPLAAHGEVLARNSGRQVIVTISGDETQLDYSTLETLKAPLRALIAFSVEQSLETPERRLAVGKPERGQLTVTLAKQDDRVVVTIDDDGAGIDPSLVARRTAQLGWPDDGHSLDLILREGYGPVSNDDTSSGGANLAEIQAELHAHGGELHVANLLSGGLRFVASVPVEMAMLDGMVVRVGEVMYIVPIDSIQRIVHSVASDLMRISAEERRYMLKLAQDDVLPVQFLMKSDHADGAGDADPFAMAPVTAETANAGTDGDGEQKYLFVVAGKSKRRVALSVDELIGQQTVMIRPLLGYLCGIRGVTGCALLGSGGVGLVLDMRYVVERARP
jgi:chemotaxis protein histidine kinase CheA